MWHLLKCGEAYGNYGNHMEYLIDSADDIETPPDDSYAPGSIAHTPGLTKMYESAADGTWVQIGGSE